MLKTLALATAMTLLSPVVANSQEICSDREDIVSQLTEDYNETSIGIGLATNGSVLELFVSPEKTWSVIVTTPHGITCLVTAGEHWEEIEEKQNNYKQL